MNVDSSIRGVCDQCKGVVVLGVEHSVETCLRAQLATANERLGVARDGLERIRDQRYSGLTIDFAAFVLKSMGILTKKT